MIKYFLNDQFDKNNEKDLEWLVETLCGEYKDVKGHHVYAKAAFINNVCYDAKKGFCISDEAMKLLNLSHKSMTAMQRKLFNELSKSGRKNTLDEHTRIAKLALIAGGATDKDANMFIDLALKNLKLQGVYEPTNIPWDKNK